MDINFQEWISSNLISLIISVVIIFIIWLSRKLTLRYVSRKIDDFEIYRKWKRISTIIIYLVGVLVILTIWYNQLSFLITFILIIVLGLVISLKEPILNLAGWIDII